MSGVFQPADGQAPATVEVVTLSIYADREGGLPLWQEMQTIALDQGGRFNVLLGATHPDGIPPEVFATGEPQWMSMLFARAGEVERPRVRITSVPYALKASDAETLGGLPASAYVRAPSGDVSVSSVETSATSMPGPTPEAVVLPGTTNYLAKYLNGADVGNSAAYETPTALVPTGAVGIGTTAPQDVLHLRFNSPDGQLTGLAVQNIANSPTAYSGMLFYDHTGALKQFQGYNNQTGEYRINNIASGGSINFMLGSVSRLFMAPSGNIGIGTTNPQRKLEVVSSSTDSTALLLQNTTSAGPLFLISYGSVGGGLYWPGRDSANTTAILTTKPFVVGSNGGILFSASNNAEHMRISSAGNIGIGTTSPDLFGRLAVVASGTGVVSRSTESHGIFGQADSSGGFGVQGYSPGGIGVVGNTVSGVGVYAGGFSNGSTALQMTAARSE